MTYRTTPEMARLCNCPRQKVGRLARAEEIEALPPKSERNPSPVWLIADTPANRARLSVKAKTGRKTK